MGIMESIKKGFGVATRNMGLVLVLFIFNAIWAIGSIPFATPAQPQAPLQPAALGFSIVFILVSIWVQGGTLGMVRDYLKEGSAKLGRFVSYGLKYYLRLLGIGVVIVLFIAIIAILATVIIASTAPLKKLPVTVAATTVAVILGLAGLYVIILLLMSPYCAVCEEAGMIGAMRSSVRFVRGCFWKVAALLALLVLISFGVGFVVGFLVGLATIALPPKAGQAVMGVANSAFNAYLGVMMMTAFMSFYLGLSKKGPAASITPPSASPSI